MTEVLWLNDGDVVEAKRGRFVAEKGRSYGTSTILLKNKSLVRIRNICRSEAEYMFNCRSVREFASLPYTSELEVRIYIYIKRLKSIYIFIYSS